MVKCLESNEVPFYAIRDEEDKVPLLCDRTSIEQWRLAGKIHDSFVPKMSEVRDMRLALLFFDIISIVITGLPFDTFFTENAVAIHASCSK